MTNQKPVNPNITSIKQMKTQTRHEIQNKNDRNQKISKTLQASKAHKISPDPETPKPETPKSKWCKTFRKLRVSVVGLTFLPSELVRERVVRCILLSFDEDLWVFWSADLSELGVWSEADFISCSRFVVFNCLRTCFVLRVVCISGCCFIFVLLYFCLILCVVFWMLSCHLNAFWCRLWPRLIAFSKLMRWGAWAGGRAGGWGSGPRPKRVKT